MAEVKSEQDAFTLLTLIQLVSLGDISTMKNLLLKGEAKVNDTDSNGMTALHHAAYKGNTEMCKMLLDHGADVSSDSHDHRYSALHFAALSGNTETVQLLLTSGAKTYHTNTLGRTAAQMAAFVGNHAVVALINNYLPLSDVLKYTAPTGLEKEAKLPSSVAKPLYDLIMQVNLHPVKIAFSVENSEELQKNITSAWKVLEILCEKESKQSENVNEVICLKFHYLAFVFKTLEKELKKLEPMMKEEGFVKDNSIFESIIRKWLRGRHSDGFEEHLEYYIRDAIKGFPYVEMPLFMQLARNITGGEIGDTSALCILSGCINGQRAFQDDKSCSTCGQEQKALKRCSKCKMVQYCDRCCQKLHWPIHKKFCNMLQIEYKKQMKKLEEEKEREAEENEEKGKREKENEKKNLKEEELASQEVRKREENVKKIEDTKCKDEEMASGVKKVEIK